MQDPTPARIHLLVTLPAHGQGGIHVDVVTCQIETDQPLEDDSPSGKGRCKEHQQTRRGAPVRHHVQHCTEGSPLVIPSGGHTVRGIEDARETVQSRTRPRVERHVIERSDRQDDPGIACLTLVISPPVSLNL